MQLNDINNARVNSEVHLIDFTCNIDGDKFVIQAICQSIRYQAERKLDPDIDFDEIKDQITKNKYTLISKTPETLKVKIAFLNFELKNKQAKIISELQKNVTELTSTVNTLIEENTILKKETKDLRESIHLLATKLSDLAEKVNKNEKNTIDLIQLQSEKIDDKFSDFQTKQQSKRLMQIQANSKAEQKSEKIVSNSNQVQGSIKQILSAKKLQKKIEKLQKRYNKNFACIQPLLFAPKAKLYHLPSCSKIVSSFEEQNNLKGFFGDKVISYMQLLYRASKNQFLAKRFHDTCDNIPNTLILCETQFGKKIGGFTPLCWESIDNNDSEKFQKDDDKESFVFSLTNNDKLKVDDYDKAIQNDKNAGPIFGRNDFGICDKANKDNDSWALINRSYKSQKYQQNTSGIRFVGSPSNESNFKAKEWQVWRIEFCSDDESDDDTYRTEPVQANDSDNETYRSQKSQAAKSKKSENQMQEI